MSEGKSVKRIFAHAGRAGLLLMAVFLVVYLITIVAGSSDFFNESAEKNAVLYFDEDIDRATELAQHHYQNLYKITDRLEYAKSSEDVESIVASYIGSELFGDLRYYSQGKSYAANGVLVEEELSGGGQIEALAASNEAGCTGVYYDKSTQLDCIAFFVPVRGSAYVDGILSIIPARNVINVGEVINEKASVVAIIDYSGKVLSDKRAEGFETSVGNNFYDFLDVLTHGKTDANEVARLVGEREKTACTIDTMGVGYTVAISPLDAFSNNIVLISMSVSEGLIAPELTYIRHIVNLLAIAIIALIVGFVFSMLYQRKAKEAISIATLVDPLLECPNIEQFRRTAKSLMLSPKRRYSVCVFSIKNFMYLEEQLGDGSVIELLKFIAKIMDSFSTAEECYGYAGDGKFVLLVLNANSHSLKDKIKLIRTVSNRNDLLKERGIKLRYDVGVCNAFEARRRTVQELIERANVACGYAENDLKNPYTLFTEEVRKEIAHEEQIEAQMESALANREFRLFLQPKYNVHNDRIDSAEALVRWFDPRKGDYRFPGEFIPLFETNGFIVKLDHFVYIEVLEYLSNAAARGEKVVPVSVNVSRVTASQDDFLNFYIGNKKKYRIPDGFITVELTESFAMEDYDKIFNIVDMLHKNGMLCSIDDFGSGYSSFNILKQITVDELKLDSVFTKRGADVARDNKLLSTIIDLAKSMGMMVVQEGVETKEVFDKVIDMGCDVIQGYYYAKAISVEEFKIFVNSNTSIKYKSLVK